MRWSKTKDIDKAKVISAKILSPDKTLQEIQDETGINRETARKILDVDLPEVVQSSVIIAEIINNDMESVKEMSELTKMYMKQIKVWALENWIDKSELQVANTTADSAFKRSQLLQGKSTENVWISGYDLLQEIKTGKLTKESAYETMQKLKSAK